MHYNLQQFQLLDMGHQLYSDDKRDSHYCQYGMLLQIEQGCRQAGLG